MKISKKMAMVIVATSALLTGCVSDDVVHAHTKNAVANAVNNTAVTHPHSSRAVRNAVIRGGLKTPSRSTNTTYRSDYGKAKYGN